MPNGWGLDTQTQLLADCNLTTCMGDIVLTSQEEVNAFGQNGCTTIEGSLTISDDGSGTPITDLSPLSGITAITEALSINDNPSLQSLNGLQAITILGIQDPIALFSGFVLSIQQNDALSDISALNGLTFLNSLSIGNNQNLSLIHI